MKTSPLSAATRERLDALFVPSKRAKAEELLVNQGGNNLPFCENLDMFGLERLRFAALKLSEGKLDLLQRAIELAQRDWRDLLMAVGFGYDITAHQRWRPALPQS
jgi:hypothetical protein